MTLNKAQITKDAEALYNALVRGIKQHHSQGTSEDHWRVAYVAIEALALIINCALDEKYIDGSAVYELAAEIAEKASKNQRAKDGEEGKE